MPLTRWRIRRSPPSRGETVAVIILAVLMGTLFLGMLWWQAPVQQAEAIPVQAALQEVEGVHNRRHGLKEIKLTFAGGRVLFVDSANATGRLLMELRALPPGTACTMLTHPYSPSTLLALEANGHAYLAFEDALRQQTGEGLGFAGLGVCLYVVAVWNARYLFRQWKKEKCN